MSSTASDLDATTEALAHRMVVTIEAGDVDGWGAAFAPGAVTWHSYDGQEMPAQQNVEMLRQNFAGVIDELHYRDVRRHAFDGGYVGQHSLVMRAKNGATYSTGVCIVVHVEGGLVTRLDEYLDSSVIQFSMENSSAAVDG